MLSLTQYDIGISKLFENRNVSITDCTTMIDGLPRSPDNIRELTERKKFLTAFCCVKKCSFSRSNCTVQAGTAFVHLTQLFALFLRIIFFRQFYAYSVLGYLMPQELHAINTSLKL